MTSGPTAPSPPVDPIVMPRCFPGRVCHARQASSGGCCIHCGQVSFWVSIVQGEAVFETSNAITFGESSAAIIQSQSRVTVSPLCLMINSLSLKVTVRGAIRRDWIVAATTCSISTPAQRAIKYVSPFHATEIGSSAVSRPVKSVGDEDNCDRVPEYTTPKEPAQLRPHHVTEGVRECFGDFHASRPATTSRAIEWHNV